MILLISLVDAVIKPSFYIIILFFVQEKTLHPIQRQATREDSTSKTRKQALNDRK
jgi:hypothetical protein